MTILKTAKWARSIEAAFEILTRIVGMFIVYLGFDYLLELISASSGSQDLLVSMLLLPALYILKDAHNITEPFTVKVEFYSDKISVSRGVAPRIKDTLEFKSSENIEVITSLLGHFLNYGTVRLYSPGGQVEIPYVCNPDKVISNVEGAKTIGLRGINSQSIWFTLPLGVHFLCLSKENEPKEKIAHACPMGSFAFQTHLRYDENSLRSNSRRISLK